MSVAPIIARILAVDITDDSITVDLADGRSISVPIGWYPRLAHATPEPAAARLYRLLATSDVGAGETLAAALRHTANDLRAQRREDVERLAVRRRFQMLIPMIFVMAPVLVLFLAAPIPHLIFGGS